MQPYQTNHKHQEDGHDHGHVPNLPSAETIIPLGTYGPHKSHLANTLDPTVDWDLSGDIESGENATGSDNVKTDVPGVHGLAVKANMEDIADSKKAHSRDKENP